MGMAWELVPGTVPAVTLPFTGVWSLLSFKDLCWFYLAVITLCPCSWPSVGNTRPVNRQALREAALVVPSSIFPLQPAAAATANPLPAPGSAPEGAGRQSAPRPRAFAVGSARGEIAVARGAACADTARRCPPRVPRTPAPLPGRWRSVCAQRPRGLRPAAL